MLLLSIDHQQKLCENLGVIFPKRPGNEDLRHSENALQGKLGGWEQVVKTKGTTNHMFKQRNTWKYIKFSTRYSNSKINALVERIKFSHVWVGFQFWPSVSWGEKVVDVANCLRCPRFTFYVIFQCFAKEAHDCLLQRMLRACNNATLVSSCYTVLLAICHSLARTLAAHPITEFWWILGPRFMFRSFSCIFDSLFSCHDLLLWLAILVHFRSKTCTASHGRGYETRVGEEGREKMTPKRLYPHWTKAKDWEYFPIQSTWNTWDMQVILPSCRFCRSGPVFLQVQCLNSRQRHLARKNADSFVSFSPLIWWKEIPHI